VTAEEFEAAKIRAQEAGLLSEETTTTTAG